jgi:AbrB family looped-hinge helix DNA binding protein
MTLPKSIRDDLQVGPGDTIDIVKDGERYVIVPRNRRAADLYGMLHRAGEKSMTVKQMDEALGRALAREDRRTRARR